MQDWHYFFFKCLWNLPVKLSGLVMERFYELKFLNKYTAIYALVICMKGFFHLTCFPMSGHKVAHNISLLSFFCIFRIHKMSSLSFPIMAVVSSVFFVAQAVQNFINFINLKDPALGFIDFLYFCLFYFIVFSLLLSSAYSGFNVPFLR